MNNEIKYIDIKNINIKESDIVKGGFPKKVPTLQGWIFDLSKQSNLLSYNDNNIKNR